MLTTDAQTILVAGNWKMNGSTAANASWPDGVWPVLPAGLGGRGTAGLSAVPVPGAVASWQ